MDSITLETVYIGKWYLWIEKDIIAGSLITNCSDLYGKLGDRYTAREICGMGKTSFYSDKFDRSFREIDNDLYWDGLYTFCKRILNEEVSS